MRMNTLAAAAGLLMTVTGATESAAQPCPAEIETRQSLVRPAPGWSDLRGSAPHRLNQVALHAGHPEERATLAPVSTGSVRDREISTWQLGQDDGRRIWMECGYAGTSITLARELPAKTRICTVATNPRIRIAGRPRIDAVECR